MGNNPTPVTAAVPLVLARYREAVGLTKGGLAGCAGVHVDVPRRIENRRISPRLDDLEQLVDVFGVPLSEFVAECEAAATGRPLIPVPELALRCRPSRNWTEAVGMAAACLAVEGFEWGLLMYCRRPVAMIPTGNGQVRLDLVRGGDDLIAQFAALVRGGV
jgi:transcriptional regulator with XRE-family HTH domain